MSCSLGTSLTRVCYESHDDREAAPKHLRAKCGRARWRHGTWAGANGVRLAGANPPVHTGRFRHFRRLRISARNPFDNCLLPTRNSDSNSRVSMKAAANLLALALMTAAAVALVTGCIVWIAGDQIVRWLEQPGLRGYLWLLSVGVWLSGSYTALQFWSTRRKQFPLIARTRFSQAVGGASTQVFCGWLGTGPIGLILGHVVYRGAGIVRLMATAIRGPQSALRLIQPDTFLETLRANAKFPNTRRPKHLQTLLQLNCRS